FSEVDIENAAFNGSVGITARPGQTWMVKLLFSSGFRSPNVDDYGKVFSKNEKVVVPNDNLKPEFAYNVDFGIDKSFLHDKIKLAANVFYTLLNDAIVRKEYALNGNDSMMIDGEMNLIQANVNANRAHLYGYGCGFTISPTTKLSFIANYNYTFGYDDTNAEPLGHIPPAFGKVSVKYQGAKWNCVLFSDFNGEKPISLYNLSGVDNESEATDDGTPAWFTLNLSNSLMISDKLELQFGVFNILDQHYKPFASGISGPGRNFTATLRASI
ncbi:MAG: TonB-dependent receptor domain-containing protein, partial [Flavobacteriales bacterium]